MSLKIEQSKIRAKSLNLNCIYEKDTYGIKLILANKSRCDLRTSQKEGGITYKHRGSFARI